MDYVLETNDLTKLYGHKAAADGVNLRKFLGASVKLYKNDDGDFIGVKDCESTFLTGDLNAAGDPIMKKKLPGDPIMKNAAGDPIMKHASLSDLIAADSILSAILEKKKF